MKNLILTIGAVAVGYALYREWMKSQEKQKSDVLVKTETTNAINKAKNSSMSNGMNNFEVFSSMKGVFDASIDKTVAPSVNAPIGIF